MIRHIARQLAVQTLYQSEVGGIPLSEAVENIAAMAQDLKEEAYGVLGDDLSLKDHHQLQKHFELDEFYHHLVEGVFNNLDSLDAVIEQNLEGWSLKRLNKVDKAILRLAAFELANKTEMAPVVINEALELTKEFSNADGKATAFNNKVLDKMKESLEG
ncbi:MAG: transcription antitermination factor NusB [Turicibacter sp.]|nr:transcription antitermination factor NusB [Turicibacter sp.]